MGVDTVVTPISGLMCARGRTATIGLVVRDGVVVDGPPYGRKMGLIGRSAREVWKELSGAGWMLVWLPDPPILGVDDT